MAATKTLYWAHGGDASKADRAWAQTTDRWPRSRSLLLTLLNKYLFNLMYIWVAKMVTSTSQAPRAFDLAFCISLTCSNLFQAFFLAIHSTHLVLLLK